MAGEPEPAMPDLLKKIRDCIRQRCSEPQLTVADVAASLKISPRDPQNPHYTKVVLRPALVIVGGTR
jgi:hypothetical protein